MFDKIKNINDGGLLRDGVLFSTLFLIVILFSNPSISPLSILLFIVACALLIFWTIRAYALQQSIAYLFAPLLFLVGIYVLFTIPITTDELPGGPALTYGDAATFSRFVSLPSFWVGNFLGLTEIQAAYFARVISFVFQCACISYAVSILPYCQSIAAIISFMPATLRSITTASPIGMSFSLSLLFVALSLRAAYKQYQRLTNKDTAILLVCAGFMLFSSIATLPMLIFILMIPKEYFQSKQHFRRFLIILFVITILICVAWIIYAPIAVPPLTNDADRYSQMTYILTHPFHFIGTVMRTAVYEGGTYLIDLLTSPIHRVVEQTVSWPYILTISICVFYAVYFDSGLSPKRFFVIRCTALSVFIYVLATMTLYYVSCSPVGSSMILDLYGDYFIPALFPGVLFLKRLFKHPAAPQKNLSFALLLAALSNLAAIYTL